MYKFIIIISSLLILASCASQKTGKTVTISNETGNQEDSVTYELIIMDPEFESWMITNSRPVEIARDRSASGMRGFPGGGMRDGGMGGDMMMDMGMPGMGMPGMF